MNMATSEDQYREPTDFERRILQRLLDLGDAEQDLRTQVASCRVRITDCADDYYGLEIEVPGERRHTSLVPLVEAAANDTDGVPIEAILFLVEERPFEVEILKLDGSPILKMPAPEEFDVLRA